MSGYTAWDSMEHSTAASAAASDRQQSNSSSGYIPWDVVAAAAAKAEEAGGNCPNARDHASGGLKPVDSSEGLAMRAALLGLPDELELEAMAFGSSPIDK